MVSFAEPLSLRRQAGLYLVAATWMTALAVTLYPFRFELDVAAVSRIDWRVYYPRHNDRDLVLNLLMLMPLGAGWALWRSGRATITRIALEAAAIGVGTALLIESLQIFERVRFPQLADVWRNGVGCIFGAVVVAWLVSRVRAR